MQYDITLNTIFADTATVFPLKMYGIIAIVGSCHAKCGKTKISGHLSYFSLNL